jgi:hypothetical protein
MVVMLAWRQSRRPGVRNFTNSHTASWFRSVRHALRQLTVAETVNAEPSAFRTTRPVSTFKPDASAELDRRPMAVSASAPVNITL